MNIQVNGEATEAPDGTSVASLLEQLEIKATRVAVELNLEIVPKASYPETLIQEGDRLEVVGFVGGG
jgi:thiamine biosynthesis protein ThiS